MEEEMEGEGDQSREGTESEKEQKKVGDRQGER